MLLELENYFQILTENITCYLRIKVQDHEIIRKLISGDYNNSTFTKKMVKIVQHIYEKFQRNGKCCVASAK